MAEMDRPDGLGVLWIAAGAALALLFVVVTVLAVVGKSALLGWAATGEGGGWAVAIAGVLTAVLLVAGTARWRGVRRVRMWMLTVLAGLTCGAWATVLLVGGQAT